MPAQSLLNGAARPFKFPATSDAQPFQATAGQSGTFDAAPIRTAPTRASTMPIAGTDSNVTLQQPSRAWRPSNASWKRAEKAFNSARQPGDLNINTIAHYPSPPLRASTVPLTTPRAPRHLPVYDWQPLGPPMHKL